MRRSGSKESTIVYSALSLAQAGRGPEALALLEPLKSTPINSLELLDIIQAVYDDQKKGEESFVFWEKFLQTYGKQEKNLLAYFKASIRIKSLSHQRKAAVELQKNFPSRKHTLWVISSLYLLSKKSENEVEQRLLKALAEKTAKLIFEKPTGYIDSCEEFHLYLDVLLLVEDKDRALDALIHQDADRFVDADADLLLRKLELLASCARWDSLFTFSLSLFQTGNTDWKVCKALLDSASNDDSKLVPLKDCILKALSTSSTKRNLHLLWIEASARFFPEEHESALLGYIKKLYMKPIVFEDLRPYLLKLNADAQHRLLDAFKLADLGESNESQKVDKLYAEVLLLKIHFLLFESFTAESVVDYVRRCFVAFEKGLSLSKGLLPTDFTHGYEALLLAVHSLIYMWEGNKELKPVEKQALIFDAICLLEKGITYSQHNFHLKLPLIRLYLLLDGGFPAAAKVYDTMSIKQIQNDTLDHYLLTRATTYYPSSVTSHYINSSLKIYGSNEFETPEMISMAYEDGAYSQIEDMRNFRSRLDHSTWKSIALVERARIHYLTAFKPPKQYLPKCSSPKDNRDLKVFADYGSDKLPTVEESLRNSPKPDTLWIHLTVIGHSLVQDSIVNGDFEKAVLSAKEMEVLCENNDLSKQLTSEEIVHMKLLIQLGLLSVKVKNGDYENSSFETIEKLIESFDYENSTPLSQLTKYTEIINDLITCLNSFLYHVSATKKKEFTRQYQLLKNISSNKLGSISGITKHKKKAARKYVSELLSNSWLSNLSETQVRDDYRALKL